MKILKFKGLCLNYGPCPNNSHAPVVKGAFAHVNDKVVPVYFGQFKDSRHSYPDGSAKLLSTEDGVLADIIIRDSEVVNFYDRLEKDAPMYLSCYANGLKYHNSEICDGNIRYVAIVEEGYGDRFVPEIVEEDKEND